MKYLCSAHLGHPSFWTVLGFSGGATLDGMIICCGTTNELGCWTVNTKLWFSHCLLLSDWYTHCSVTATVVIIGYASIWASLKTGYVHKFFHWHGGFPLIWGFPKHGYTAGCLSWKMRFTYWMIHGVNPHDLWFPTALQGHGQSWCSGGDPLLGAAHGSVRKPSWSRAGFWMILTCKKFDLSNGDD